MSTRKLGVPLAVARRKVELISRLETVTVRLLSEDLSHGQVIDGVRIENPFL